MMSRFILCSSLLLPAALAAQTPTPAPAADTGRATVLGLAHDSLTREPLPGAVVQLASYPEVGRRSFTVVADSIGTYRIDSVPGGQYLIGFFHPRLDALRLEPPLRLIEVPREGPYRADVAIPSARTLRQHLCGAAAAPDDSTGVLVGRVRDADTQSPLGGSTVVVIWSELTLGARGLSMDRRQYPIETGADGWYAICGLPAGTELVARAEHAADSSGFIEVTLDPGGLLLRDFNIGRSDTTIALAAEEGADDAPPVRVRRGSARLAGVVRNVAGRPLGGAQVELYGSGVEGRTDDEGRFSLSELPTGTHSLEVRQIGYAPKRVTVDLRRQATATVSVEMERTQQLATVRVLGKAPSRRSISGFLERRQRGGFGRFMTREDIEKWRIFRTSDIMRRMPGVQVTPSGAFAQVITMRGRCKPSVFVDGMEVPEAADDLDRWVQPHDIAGIEVYNGSVGAPPQFSRNACGSIVIWTGASAR